jgi:hypothetical protein
LQPDESPFWLWASPQNDQRCRLPAVWPDAQQDALLCGFPIASHFRLQAELLDELSQPFPSNALRFPTLRFPHAQFPDALRLWSPVFPLQPPNARLWAEPLPLLLPDAHRVQQRPG